MAKLTEPTQPTFYFIGVTTGKSSINKVFPLWMKELGREEVILHGVDHPIHDEPDNYRKTVAHIRDQKLAVGGLVTTHKLDLFAACHNMFDDLDDYAKNMHEVSCISKHDGKLQGYAIDAISSRLTLNAILGKGYFGRTGGHVLCLGAGGAALATLLHLITQPDTTDRPSKFVAVDIHQDRLDHMRSIVKQYDTDIQVDYRLHQSATDNDKLMATMPPYTLVINATGMGKDTPGSPITDNAVFPENGVIWEYNYRGELDFYHQAKHQQTERNLQVEDGWLYFLHGWTQVLARALHIDLTPDLFARLDAAASTTRKPLQ